jgi:hypothetical protein
MYGAREKPKVNYPKVKTKKRAEPVREIKPCPQKTVIEYPEQPRKSKYKFSAIDFVPHRKQGDLIMAEIDSEKNKPLGLAPGRRGVDRGKEIQNLQENFQFENKAAMDAEIAARRKAESDALSKVSTMTERERREAKYKMGIAQKAIEHYEAKYGPNPSL